MMRSHYTRLRPPPRYGYGEYLDELGVQRRQPHGRVHVRRRRRLPLWAQVILTGAAGILAGYIGLAIALKVMGL